MSAMKRRLPDSYFAAAWRNTTPVDGYYREVGVGFDLPDGTVIRVRLSVEHAQQLRESLGEQLDTHAARVHSDKSSGMPSNDVSKPDE